MAAPIPPSPGAAAPGELYVDLQSRTLWLGVAAAVDPDLAVLISDIEGQAEDYATILAGAKAYTDQKLIGTSGLGIDPDGYSGIGHKHVAADITDFETAVEAVVGAPGAPSGGNFVKGMIVLWSGLLSAIGTGALAGWALCDGANGTPNLRDRFILGAGNKAVGVINSLSEAPTTQQGAHTPVVGATSLTAAQIPAHSHGLVAGKTATEVGDHTHAISITTAAAGTHSHGPATGIWGSYNSSPSNRLDTQEGSGVSFPGQITTTTPNGSHSHTVSGTSGGKSGTHTHELTGTTDSYGAGEAHTHTMAAVPNHAHAVLSNNLREALPYYALAYIMKL